MEQTILKTLQYKVTVPTPHTFLVRFLKAAYANKLMTQLANFLLDGTLLSLALTRYRPSQLAAGVILLVRRQLGERNWSQTLVKYSNYQEQDAISVAEDILQNKHQLEQNCKLEALAKKYSTSRYGKVSHTVFLPLTVFLPRKIQQEILGEGLEPTEHSVAVRQFRQPLDRHIPHGQPQQPSTNRHIPHEQPQQPSTKPGYRRNYMAPKYVATIPLTVAALATMMRRFIRDKFTTQF